MRTSFAWIVVVLALSGVVWAQDQPGQKPRAEQAQPTRAEKLKEAQVRALIEHIGQAEGIITARTALRRAQVIDRDNPDVLDAYLRKALQLGRPDYAVESAADLARINPKHTLAWALLAYDAARDGQMPRALRYTLLALEADADNPGVLHNAGQALAWYDNQPIAPQLPNALLARLVKVRDQIDEKPAFKRSYERFMALYDRQAEMGQRLEGQVQRDQALLEGINGQILTLQKELREINDKIAEQEQLEDAYELELYLAHRHPTRISKYYDPRRGVVGGYGVGHIGYVDGVVVGRLGYSTGRTIIIGDDDNLFVNSHRAAKYRRGALRDAIDRADDRGDDLRALRRRYYHTLRRLTRQSRRLSEDIDQVQELIDNPAKAVQRRLAWDPPAIEGQVVHESPTAPERSVEPIELPTDPEIEASGLLRLARLYLTNGYFDQAAARVQKLLESYPDTEAAAEARKMLTPAGQEGPEQGD